MQSLRTLFGASALALIWGTCKPISLNELNGWYPCSEFTFQDEGGSGSRDAECAMYTAPLCYPGRCAIDSSIDSTVDIFVKRIAAKRDAETARNVWLMQGGPGASSSASKCRNLSYRILSLIRFPCGCIIVESAMVEIHTRLAGAVNVYTMDHRGTGRSTLLDCVAAQVTTTGSPLGSSIEVSEVPACAQALERKYGNLSSFSMTTAATDMATFLANHSNGADTIVYGVSYGTALVERLIHLAPPSVTGYVLDGVATSSGSSREFEYFSTWDVDFGTIGAAFLTLCATERECSAKFPSSLATTVQNVMTELDTAVESPCAVLMRNVNSERQEPASYSVRRALGEILQDAELRTFIPSLVYRLDRCAAKDVDVLTHFFATLEQYLSWSREDDALESTLLYYLIVFSEMWERPQPSLADMMARFTTTLVSNGGAYLDVPRYCAFSKEKSLVCDALHVGTYSANALIYERDEYWNKSARIPPHASVLLLSSKLDPQTPHKYAEALLEALRGTKELVTFTHATHGTLWTTPMDDVDASETCGMKVLLSYVSTNGDLTRLDKSCVHQMPALRLTPSRVYQYYFFSTEDAYDGDYDGSLAARVTSTFTGSGLATFDGNATYKTPFIVVLVLFVGTLTAALFFAYRWYQLKTRELKTRETDDLPEVIGISTISETEASVESREGK